MKKKIVMCLLVVFLIGGGIAPFSLFSQDEPVVEESREENPHQFFQLSFFYPLSTNWINAFNISNTISLNILIGFNGGVQGFEAGIININRGNVLGFQAAALLNINKGHSTGLISSGLGNILVGDGTGVFFSPIFNIHQGSVTGLQFSTINYAKKLKGLQLGLINIVGDGKEAIPLGLLNIVIKHGYRAFDVYAGDLFYGNVSFKMGVERLYTIFKGSYTMRDSDSIYAFGIGLGTIIPLSKKHRINIDAIFGSPISRQTIDPLFNQTINALSFFYELNVHYRYAVTKHFELFIGPSFNYLHYIDTQREGEDNIVIKPHYTLLSEETHGKRETNYHYFWIGGNAGISLRF